MPQRSPLRSLRRGSTLLVAVPAVAVVTLGLAACSNSQEPSHSTSTSVPAVWTGTPEPGSEHAEQQNGGDTGASLTAAITDPSGGSVGNATFATAGNVVRVHVTAKELTPGMHALQIHSVGKCEAHSADPSDPAKEGDFLSAGPVLTTSAAGANNASPSGELSPIQIGADGTGELATTTSAVTLPDLTRGSGTAIVVTSDSNDQNGSATRVACGVIHKQ